ncbi:PorT family protein [Flavobacterium sp. SM15]|uniref:porin family protein n=1 Tax=Flavobacterium sp. SM15 TaxID=2908005 RepID=UPI001EDB9418|nr:porin family protein [Flavobacterium sp. SM15]MCG2610124.1 PorT family protein [Flavobacterium sp. SM15]
MNFIRILFFIVLFPLCLSAQQTEEVIKTPVDSLYREDQFYLSLSYNLVQNSPGIFKQFSFSPVITFGFLRDIPFVKSRRWSVAPGIGYNYNNIKQFINSRDLFQNDPTVASEDIRTRITSHSVELPLEVRWRNSTAQSHKFWRIYSGFKARYVLSSKLVLDSSEGRTTEDVKSLINKWQYGTYMTAGYNTWNVYVYYGLNPIFKDGSKLSDFTVGFMFYIL